MFNEKSSCYLVGRILDNVDYLIWIKNKDDEFVYANKTACEVLFMCDQEKIPQCKMSTEATSYENKKRVVEERIRLKGGGELWIEASKLPIDEEGLMLTIAKDITEQKQHEIELENALKQKIEEFETERREQTELLDIKERELMSVLEDIKGNGFSTVV